MVRLSTEIDEGSTQVTNSLGMSVLAWFHGGNAIVRVGAWGVHSYEPPLYASTQLFLALHFALYLCHAEQLSGLAPDSAESDQALRLVLSKDVDSMLRETAQSWKAG